MLDSCVDYVERIPGTCVEIVDCGENGDLFSLFVLTSLSLCCPCFCRDVMIFVWGGFSCHWIGMRGRGDPLCHHCCVLLFRRQNIGCTVDSLQISCKYGRQTDWHSRNLILEIVHPIQERNVCVYFVDEVLLNVELHIS
jgi:hypothetical protein